MNLYPWEVIALFIRHREKFEDDYILHLVGVFTSTKNLMKALRKLELENKLVYMSDDKDDWYKKPFGEFGYRGIEDCFESQIHVCILKPDKLDNWWEVELSHNINVIKNGHYIDGYGETYSTLDIMKCNI